MEHTPDFEKAQRDLTMLRSHVERCLQDIWDVKDVPLDDDGDYPFRFGTAACWVRVLPGQIPGVRVFATSAFGVRSSAKLLGELNDLNTRSGWVKVGLIGGVVQVWTDLHWAAVDRLPLDQAMHAVGSVAADNGALLAGMFGGRTPHQPVDTGHDRTEEAA